MLLMASSSNAIYRINDMIHPIHSILSENSGIIEAMAAIANLVLVVWIFFREKKDIDKRELKRIEEVAYDKWFDLLVRDRVVNAIEKYFQEIKTTVDEIVLSNKNSDAIICRMQIEPIKNSFNVCKRIVNPILLMFDDKLKSDIWEILQEGNDTILEQCEKYLSKIITLDTVYETIQNNESEIIKKIFDFDKKRLEQIVNRKD